MSGGRAGRRLKSEHAWMKKGRKLQRMRLKLLWSVVIYPNESTAHHTVRCAGNKVAMLRAQWILPGCLTACCSRATRKSCP